MLRYSSAMLLLLGCIDYGVEKNVSPTDEGAPDISVSPTDVDVGPFADGEVGTATVRVENLGDTVLTLDRAEVVGGTAFTLLSIGANSLEPAGATDIVVQYRPMSPSDTSSLELASNDPDEPLVVVPLAGQGLLPILSVSPMSIDFGTIGTDAVVTEDVTLENIGSAPLTVASLLIGGTGFSTLSDPAPVDLDPGEQQTVTVQFSSATIGDYTGQLYVQDNTAVGGATVALSASVAAIPVAVCSVDPSEVQVGLESATFYGRDSYDPMGGALVYNWQLMSAPAGASARLSGNGPNVTLSPDVAGRYTAQLVVTASGMESAPCEVSLDAIPAQDLWVELSWTYANDDMDLHLVQNDGALYTDDDCSCWNCLGGLDWGESGSDLDDPLLAQDDWYGVGPETIYIWSPAAGTYTVYVHDQPNEIYRADNPITVNIYLFGQLIYTTTRTMTDEDVVLPIATVQAPDGIVTEL